jgi:hypothetical protein
MPPGTGGTKAEQEARTSVASPLVRTRLAWLGAATATAAAAAAVLARRFRQRGAEPAPSDPADELRRKLDESRALADERDEFEAGETTVDQAEPASVEARRRQVHAEAESALNEMRSDSDLEPPPSAPTEPV